MRRSGLDCYGLKTLKMKFYKAITALKADKESVIESIDELQAKLEDVNRSLDCYANSLNEIENNISKLLSGKYCLYGYIQKGTREELIKMCEDLETYLDSRICHDTDRELFFLYGDNMEMLQPFRNIIDFPRLIDKQ